MSLVVFYVWRIPEEIWPPGATASKCWIRRRNTLHTANVLQGLERKNGSEKSHARPRDTPEFDSDGRLA